MSKGEKLLYAWLLLSLLWAGFVLNQPAAHVAALFVPPIIVLVVSWFGMWIWEHVGASHWSRLPANVRRGVLRAYLASSIPWILWFAYKAAGDAGHTSRRRYVEWDLLWLVSLPLGAVILFMVGSWIIDGFRSPTPGNAIPPNSDDASASERNQASGDASRDANAIFAKLEFLLQNESAQNDGLPEPYRSMVCSGVACDEIAGANGEFGRSIRNPIPVNGPLGELIYLSNLRVVNSQHPIMFHRIGSAGAIDVFETVSFDGNNWDILYFDLYHPRKSRRSPAGYQVAGSQRSLPTGTNEFVAQFPEELPAAISIACEKLIGLRLSPAEVRKAIERIRFARPTEHQATYKSLIASLGTSRTDERNLDRAAIAKKVQATIRHRPDIAADLFIGSSELFGKNFKQRYTLRADDLSPEQIASLPAHYVSPDGLPVDEVRKLFGYVSTDSFVESLVAYQAFKGSLSRDDAIQKAADVEIDRLMKRQVRNRPC